MVQVRILRAGDGRIVGFEARGHSGLAPRGRDVLCAAVSALTQTAVLGLQGYAGLDVEVETGPGALSCRLPARLEPQARERAAAILETMALGLRHIAQDHPRHVRCVEESLPG